MGSEAVAALYTTGVTESWRLAVVAKRHTFSKAPVLFIMSYKDIEILLRYNVQPIGLVMLLLTEQVTGHDKMENLMQYVKFNDNGE